MLLRANSSVKYSPRILFLLFFFVFFSFVVNMGRWQGISSVYSPRESNAFFLLGFAFFSMVVTLLLRGFRLNLPYPKLFVVFLLNLLIMAVLRGDLINSLRQLLAIYCTIITVLFMVVLLHSMSLRDAIFIFSCALLVPLVISIYVHLIEFGSLALFSRTNQNRLGGLFFFAHFAMLAGNTALFALAGMSLSVRWSFRWFFYIFIFLIMGALLPFTDTRSVIFAVVTCVVLFYILVAQRLTLGNVFILFFIVIILALAYYYFTQTFTGAVRDQDVAYRLKIWQITWQGVLKSPFWGYGKTNYLQSSTSAMAFNTALNNTHSAILSHALQFGLISLFLFMSYYSVILLSAFSYSKRLKPLVLIGIYWILAPFVWGQIYDISGDFIQFVFLLSIIGVMCHPDTVKRS